MFPESIFDDAPLFLAIKDYASKNPARFHMPGHKAAEGSFLYELFGRSLRFDVTELPETDSFFDASGAILKAEEKAGFFFGCKTLFCAGGATLCIQAMFKLASERGKKIICARNSHRSAVNAMALLGLEPVWVWPRAFENSSLPGGIVPRDVEAALRENPDACAVYVTSPDYYGVISDIGGISRACKKFGALLLIDNAHGSHLICVQNGGLYPLRLGADICCDSAHKTLPVLTGGAYLQISNGLKDKNARAAMALFGSTSPSYPIMISLDLARAWLKECGAAAFERLSARVDEINSLCGELGFLKPQGAVFDPVRITVDTASQGIPGGEAAALLRESGVVPDMYDARHVALVPSPFNSDEEFARLKTALRKLPRRERIPYFGSDIERPSKAMSLESAVRAESEEVDIKNAPRRVAAEGKVPCPPGVPPVMPGEIVTEGLAQILKKYGVLKIKVVK
jgi:arginine decarboxylase